MVTIKVEGLDQSVMERLESRAASNNRSLESEARHILEEASIAAIDMSQRQAEFRALSRKLRERRYQCASSRTPSDGDYPVRPWTTAIEMVRATRL